MGNELMNKKTTFILAALFAGMTAAGQIKNPKSDTIKINTGHKLVAGQQAIMTDIYEDRNENDRNNRNKEQLGLSVILIDSASKSKVIFYSNYNSRRENLPTPIKIVVVKDNVGKEIMLDSLMLTQAQTKELFKRLIDFKNENKSDTDIPVIINAALEMDEHNTVEDLQTFIDNYIKFINEMKKKPRLDYDTKPLNDELKKLKASAEKLGVKLDYAFWEDGNEDPSHKNALTLG
jgi:hypothetical protein